MNRTPVSSSHLSSIGYNENSGLLEIEFKDGSIYQYSNVPTNIYEELMAASSHGKYFHRHIRDVYSDTQIR